MSLLVGLWLSRARTMTTLREKQMFRLCRTLMMILI